MCGAKGFQCSPKNPPMASPLHSRPSLAPRGQMCSDHPSVDWLACLHPWLILVRVGGWTLAVLQGMWPQGGD